MNNKKGLLLIIFFLVVLTLLSATVLAMDCPTIDCGNEGEPIIGCWCTCAASYDSGFCGSGNYYLGFWDLYENPTVEYCSGGLGQTCPDGVNLACSWYDFYESRNRGTFWAYFDHCAPTYKITYRYMECLFRDDPGWEPIGAGAESWYSYLYMGLDESRESNGGKPIPFIDKVYNPDPMGFDIYEPYVVRVACPSGRNPDKYLYHPTGYHYPNVSEPEDGTYGFYGYGRGGGIIKVYLKSSEDLDSFLSDFDEILTCSETLDGMFGNLTALLRSPEIDKTVTMYPYYSKAFPNASDPSVIDYSVENLTLEVEDGLVLERRCFYRGGGGSYMPCQEEVLTKTEMQEDFKDAVEDNTDKDPLEVFRKVAEKALNAKISEFRELLKQGIKDADVNDEDAEKIIGDVLEAADAYVKGMQDSLAFGANRNMAGSLFMTALDTYNQADRWLNLHEQQKDLARGLAEIPLDDYERFKMLAFHDEYAQALLGGEYPRQGHPMVQLAEDIRENPDFNAKPWAKRYVELLGNFDTYKFSLPEDFSRVMNSVVSEVGFKAESDMGSAFKNSDDTNSLTLLLNPEDGSKFVVTAKDLIILRESLKKEYEVQIGKMQAYGQMFVPDSIYDGTDGFKVTLSSYKKVLEDIDGEIGRLMIVEADNPELYLDLERARAIFSEDHWAVAFLKEVAKPCAFDFGGMTIVTRLAKRLGISYLLSKGGQLLLKGATEGGARKVALYALKTSGEKVFVGKIFEDSVLKGIKEVCEKYNIKIGIRSGGLRKILLGGKLDEFVAADLDLILPSEELLRGLRLFSADEIAEAIKIKKIGNFDFTHKAKYDEVFFGENQRTLMHKIQEATGRKVDPCGNLESWVAYKDGKEIVINRGVRPFYARNPINKIRENEFTMLIDPYSDKVHTVISHSDDLSPLNNKQMEFLYSARRGELSMIFLDPVEGELTLSEVFRLLRFAAESPKGLGGLDLVSRKALEKNSVYYRTQLSALADIYQLTNSDLSYNGALRGLFRNAPRDGEAFMDELYKLVNPSYENVDRVKSVIKEAGWYPFFREGLEFDPDIWIGKGVLSERALDRLLSMDDDFLSKINVDDIKGIVDSLSKFPRGVCPITVVLSEYSGLEDLPEEFLQFIVPSEDSYRKLGMDGQAIFDRVVNRIGTPMDELVYDTEPFMIKKVLDVLTEQGVNWQGRSEVLGVAVKEADWSVVGKVKLYFLR